MRLRILNDIINYSPRPSIDKMLSYEVLTVFEATCLITQWPDYIFKYNCMDISKEKDIPRTFFYEPAPPPEHRMPLEWRFRLKNMGTDFLNTYKAMKRSITSGELLFRAEYLGMDDEHDNEYEEGISYLVSPKKVIWWALLRGINISKEVQNAINVYLMKGNFEKSNQNKVKIKIIGQFLHKYFPGERISFYSKHDWLKEYVSPNASEKNKYRGIREALNELREPDPNLKQGNRSDEDIKNEPYHPKAIEEVVQIDSSGIRCYNIPLLKLVMETAANLLLGKLLEESLQKKRVDQSEKGLSQFLKNFMKHKVVSLYTQEASLWILDFIYMFAYWAVADFFYQKKMRD